MTAEQWPDHPPVDADTAVSEYELRSARAVVNLDRPEDDPAPPEEPHHAAARERTDDEQAALTPKFATGGTVDSPVDGDSPPTWLGGCNLTVPKHTPAQREALNLMRQRNNEQRAKRAERDGQLDLGGQ